MGRSGDDVSIEFADSGRLDDLQPLCESLSDHHVEVAPRLRALGPVRTSAESWAIRRSHYLSLFEEDPPAFALTASVAGDPVGYALVQMRGPEESWDTGPVAVLETLAVLPTHRRRGIGGALVGAMMAELRRRGIGHWEVATIASNREAIRFYERLDLLPFTVNYIGLVPPAAALPSPSPPLSDGVVLLRPWTERDLDAVEAVTADPEIVRRNRLPQPFDAAAWFAAIPGQQQRGEALRLLIADAATGRMTGPISLSDFRPDRRSAELGYWLVAGERKRGAAGRAVGLLCDWAFETLGLERVIAETDGDNLASPRMLEKAGFAFDGGEDEAEVRYVLIAGSSDPA